MFNKYFPEEQITFNDIYFVCFMLEHVARAQQLQNFEVLNRISRDGLYHLLSCASVLHCENADKVANDWITEYNIPTGNFHFDAVEPDLDVHIPSDQRIGKVFANIISYVSENSLAGDVLTAYSQVYNSPITLKINDYNCSAFYEPSYVQIRAFYNGQFY